MTENLPVLTVQRTLDLAITLLRYLLRLATTLLALKSCKTQSICPYASLLRGVASLDEYVDSHPTAIFNIHRSKYFINSLIINHESHWIIAGETKVQRSKANLL